MIVSWKVGIMFQNGRGGWRGWIYDVILKGGGASYLILHQLVICTNESFKIQKYQGPFNYVMCYSSVKLNIQKEII